MDVYCSINLLKIKTWFCLFLAKNQKLDPTTTTINEMNLSEWYLKIKQQQYVVFLKSHFGERFSNSNARFPQTDLSFSLFIHRFWGFLLYFQQQFKCGWLLFPSHCFLPSSWYPAVIVSKSSSCTIKLWPGCWGWCEGECVLRAPMPLCSLSAPMAKLTVSWRPLTSMLRHTPLYALVQRLVSKQWNHFIYQMHKVTWNCLCDISAN